MTLDGVCDHTVGLPDEEIHHHYEKLLGEGDAILYGRKTFELMCYWQTFLNKPSGEKSMDNFALAIDSIPKIVFSKTLDRVEWETASLANRPLIDEVLALKQQTGKAVFVGSRSLINQLMKLNLIDEYQICVQPVIAGSGLLLFESIGDRAILKLIKTKTFSGGSIILYYEPQK